MTASEHRSASRTTKHRRSASSRFARYAALFALLLVIAGVWILGLVAAPADDKIAPGVSINSVDVGGLTSIEAKQLLASKIAALRLNYGIRGQRFALLAVEPNRADRQPIASFGIDDAIIQAYAVGRETEPVQAALNKISAYFLGHAFELAVKLDQDTLNEELARAFAETVKPANDARLSIRLDGAEPLVTVEPETAGETIDGERAYRETLERLSELSNAVIVLKIRSDQPTVTVGDIEPLRDQIAAALEHAPLRLKAKEETWTVSRQLAADWISAVTDPAAGQGSAVRLGLDRTKVAKYLETRGGGLRTEPKNAAFEMSAAGRVAVFEPGLDGEEIDPEASIILIETRLFGADEAAVSPDALILPFRAVPPRITTAAANPFGIKEIIGVGDSNFKNSPTNRRTNIKVGADSLNGIIIPAGEEFSLLQALGPIDGEHGYLQELVIKQDKTVKEYGGGLCQIGTTTFRAVMNAGLPVTMRQNHSYRVPYYERDGAGNYMGPGKDATIYDPWPDFRFRNDTGNTVLLMTAIDGNRVTFTLWGVLDGRKAEQGPVKVWNEVPPPEKKLIETTDLKPGQTKCTESPHPGADTSFTYTVTSSNGEVKKTDFKSHYRPWGEVCLVGIDPNAPPAANTAPSLPSIDAAGAAGN
ncbi:MAG: VanW family protein [Patescibacteria group bacterium]|jgi:vancomycin resistance protein YoaR